MNAERLKSIINKVPAFRDLAVGHAHRLLESGEVMLKPKGTTLCVEGHDSSDMFVLLSGKLLVTCEDVELGSVGSSDVVGEMSLITGLPRCATIEVTEDATLFVIHAVNFERLMSENVELAARFYRNMLVSLCTKLRQSNRTPGGQPPGCVRLLLRRSAIDDRAGKCFFAIILEQDTGLLLRGPEKGETE